MQDSLPGPCQGYNNRWYFDARKQMCVPFIYGGCRGNRNNFLTAEECNEACSVVRDALRGNPPSSTSNNSPAAVLGGSSSSLGGDPIDCMVTPWLEWSPCSVSCGVGHSERRRMIKRPAENGGRPCPTRLVKKRSCIGTAGRNC